jgi:hypothetical protein
MADERRDDDRAQDFRGDEYGLVREDPTPYLLNPED